ncbi:MAG: ABC transporter substrate-binding protein, partial [Chloroflexota bacterium]
MRRTNIPSWLALFVIVGLLASACTPAAAPAPTAKPAEPASKPAAPAPTAKPAAEQPRTGGVLTVSNMSPAPQDLDLVSDHRVPTLTIIRPCYSGLLQYDPFDHGEVVSDLAERWEMSPDGKTYTFYLRKGVKWHDGKPFSSADAKFTLERMIDPNDPEKVRLTEKRVAMSGITQIETPDDNTLKVSLQLPRSSFIPWIGWGSLVMAPKHIPPKDLANAAVGTGAYKFKSYARGASLEMVKNTDYFIKDRPYLDGISFYIIVDQSTKLAAFKTGQLKLIRDFLPSAVREVKETMPSATLQIADKLSFGYFGMNA